MDLPDWTNKAIGLAKNTGSLLMDYWRRSNPMVVHQKSDASPVTTADLAAHDYLVEGLQKFSPHIPILSEEGDLRTHEERCQWDLYWLLDPLDGTRGFIEQLDLFSVNISLMQNHQPILGIIYVPTHVVTYYAWHQGGAFIQHHNDAPMFLKTQAKLPEAPWRILLGQYSQGTRLIQQIKDKVPYQIFHANGAVKFGLLASGQADIYPRLGAIREWDTAAGQCILQEAGGLVVDLKGQALQYNCNASLLNPEFIALADPSHLDLWLNMLNKEAP